MDSQCVDPLNVNSSGTIPLPPPPDSEDVHETEIMKPSCLSDTEKENNLSEPEDHWSSADEGDTLGDYVSMSPSSEVLEEPELKDLVEKLVDEIIETATPSLTSNLEDLSEFVVPNESSCSTADNLIPPIDSDLKFELDSDVFEEFSSPKHTVSYIGSEETKTGSKESICDELNECEANNNTAVMVYKLCTEFLFTNFPYLEVKVVISLI